MTFIEIGIFEIKRTNDAYWITTIGKPWQNGFQKVSFLITRLNKAKIYGVIKLKFFFYSIGTTVLICTQIIFKMNYSKVKLEF